MNARGQGSVRARSGLYLLSWVSSALGGTLRLHPQHITARDRAHPVPHPSHSLRSPTNSSAAMLLSSAVALVGATVVAAQGVVDADLYGTWSSKSNKTLTGPVRRPFVEIMWTRSKISRY